MIKKLHIIKYRKLGNMEFSFSKGINVISGTNGTCKTSLLHIIGNSFQAVTKKCDWVNDASCLDSIKQVNNIMNPKIEALTKGDKKHNDPSIGVPGTIFSVEYYDHEPIEFRRHNSKLNNRYAVKPYYRPGTTEKLPFCPVIYLGLTRLYPFGEFLKDDSVKKLTKNLPLSYQQTISEIYQSLSGISVSSVTPQKMGDIKTRADFVSDKDGIDSNTISAGEDNLFIILCALVSLRYYYENIQSTKEIESVLLIDEFDATLHPSLQARLLKVFREYAIQFKIQIIFTTHSLSTLEAALKAKDNVIYLIDNITSVIMMDAPDMYKIKRHLSGITGEDIYLGKSIPIFTEDAEARIVLNVLFDYYAEVNVDFANVKRYFHVVDACISAENLRSMFSDTYLLQTTMKSVCILDGDHGTELNKCIVSLPGSNSPEKVIMAYAQQLYDNDSSFWTEPFILDMNYGKIYFRDTVKPDIDTISAQLQEMRARGVSTHGKEREMRKQVFNKYDRFFTLLFKHWVRDPANTDNVNLFFKDLNIVFKKTAEFHGINPNLWPIR